MSISDSNDHRDTDNYSPFDFEKEPAYENEQEISNEPLCSEEINACNDQKIHQAKTCILSKINNIRRKVYLCISKNELLRAKAHAENYRTQIFRFVSRFEPAQSEQRKLKERSLKTLKDVQTMLIPDAVYVVAPGCAQNPVRSCLFFSNFLKKGMSFRPCYVKEIHGV